MNEIAMIMASMLIFHMTCLTWKLFSQSQAPSHTTKLHSIINPFIEALHSLTLDPPTQIMSSSVCCLASR